MVNDEAFLAELRAAEDVVITDHALERGYDPTAVRDVVEQLAGRIYLDRQTGAYHLVTDRFITVIRVRDGRRVVVTVYPGEEMPKYQTERFILLRG